MIWNKNTWLYLVVFVLTIFGLVLHLGFLSYPNETVFDEVHFGKFASAYFTGAYYFDIHPPLGKLLIALGAWLGGYGGYVREYGAFLFTNIGDPYGSVPYGWFRLLPAIAGSFIPLAVYGFMRSLKLGHRASLFAMFCLVFENALLAHTRLMLLDSFLLLFGFLGLAAFFTSRNRGYSWLMLMTAGALFSLSFSTKWTGISFLGLAGLVMIYDLIRCNRERLGSRVSIILKGIGCMGLISFLIYGGIFYVHFMLLPHTGPGDAYMSQDFRNHKLSLTGKLFELNQKMAFYNATLKATHSYGSPAWSWPILSRPIFYWHQQISSGIAGRIYLMGNPVLWWMSCIGIIAFIVFIRQLGYIDGIAKAVLLVGYGANFFPFFSVSRVLFLYHYFAAFIISVVMLGVVMEHGFSRFSPKRTWIAWFLCAMLIVVLFCFFAPLTFGIPMSDAWYRVHTWMPSWI
ncbi:MAG: Glycosyl transferase family 39 [Parcubacteria group bacterium GW2011_GWA2_46_7]|nr:MAG: Glycosyl transferase family 39 [Parcubacteria group bacterium GW2011_GWA2_46_7]